MATWIVLTVLEHGIGHLLGLDHNGDTPGNIMQDTLSLSTRRWATAVDAAIAQMLYEANERERRQEGRTWRSILRLEAEFSGEAIFSPRID
jgi:hypothetical protein